jgi:hypothetical protein
MIAQWAPSGGVLRDKNIPICKQTIQCNRSGNQFGESGNRAFFSLAINILLLDFGLLEVFGIVIDPHVFYLATCLILKQRRLQSGIIGVCIAKR